MDLQKLPTEFECIVHTPSEDGRARLISLGAEDLQVFLAGVSDDHTIGVEAWAHDKKNK